uniref:DNA 3'-5' helicase n=2 Tax=Clytia hemisphaerica TaxID=252671 RepID=A0A7M5VBC3_9CNID
MTAQPKNVEQIFAPYVTDIANNGFEATRVIVFCRTSHNLRKLFSLFDGKFSSYYPDPLSRPYARFHSRTQIEVKSMINKSLSDPNGKVRFLMATIAFGMGIDCKGLHTVIHFGTPSDMDDYFQESGRVGRDGAQSRAILLTYPHCLVSPKISKGMKAYAKNSEVCRRKVLMAQYSTDSFQSFQPLHLCCDVCEKQCDCNQEDCKSIDLHEFGLTDQTEPVVECSLNSDGIKYLKLKLTKLRESLIADHEGVVSPSISSGFSLECITQIVNIASCSLTEEDIYVKTALMNKSVITQIHELVRQVVTEPLFEKKDFDDEYYFSDESNDDSDPENSSCYRFSNDSSGESDCE